MDMLKNQIAMRFNEINKNKNAESSENESSDDSADY